MGYLYTVISSSLNSTTTQLYPAMEMLRTSSSVDLIVLSEVASGVRWRYSAVKTRRIRFHLRIAGRDSAVASSLTSVLTLLA